MTLRNHLVDFFPGECKARLPGNLYALLFGLILAPANHLQDVVFVNSKADVVDPSAGLSWGYVRDNEFS